MHRPGSARTNSLEFSFRTAQETFEIEQQKLKDKLADLLISKLAKDAVGSQDVETALEEVIGKMMQQRKASIGLTNECIEAVKTQLEDSQAFIDDLKSLKSAVSALDFPEKITAVDSILTEAQAHLRLQVQNSNKPKVFPVQFLGEATCTGDCCCSATVVNFKSACFSNVYVTLEPDVGRVQCISLGNIEPGAQVIAFSVEPFSDLCKDAEIRLEIVLEDDRRETISKKQHLTVDSEPIPYCSLTKIRTIPSVDPGSTAKLVPSVSRYAIAKVWHLAKERYPTLSDYSLEQVFDSVIQQQTFSWEEVDRVLRNSGYR